MQLSITIFKCSEKPRIWMAGTVDGNENKCYILFSFALGLFICCTLEQIILAHKDRQTWKISFVPIPSTNPPFFSPQKQLLLMVPCLSYINSMRYCVTYTAMCILHKCCLHILNFTHIFSTKYILKVLPYQFITRCVHPFTI